MSDKVLFQTDDALSEPNLAMRRARDNSTDYVERGFAVTPDWANGAFDVSGGHAVVTAGVKAYDVFADPRTDLALADSSGTNYVFLVADPGEQDSVEVAVDADGSAPSESSLLIATLDANAKTVSPENRRPDGSYGALDADALRADAQRGVADTFVSTTSELEAAFDDLSPGETVRIARPDSPYRPGQWLDVDADHVTVVAESPFARDGQPLVKPADGSDVGGVRVGHDAATKHVRIEGLGFHGNAATMSDSAKRLHGFVADQKASHVTFRDNVVTRTHPYHEHDTGGSGFVARSGASHVEVVENFADDVGDHGVQVAGTNVLVRGNVLTNGYGHSISLSVVEPDGKSYVAKNVSVADNFGRDNAKGSFVGLEGATQRADRGYFSIVGNVATGQHRKLVQLGNTSVDVKAVSVVGNVGDGTGTEHVGVRSAVQTDDSWVNVSDNVLVGYGYGGVKVKKGHNVSVTNNLVAGVGGEGIICEGYSNHKIAGNVVRAAADAGIRVNTKTAPFTVAQNQIRFCDAQGIVVDQFDESGFDEGGLVYGNALDENDQAANGVAELDVKTGNVLAFGNYVAARGGSASFSDAGSSNHWVGNVAPADGSAWSLESATDVRAMANRPNPAGKGFVVTTPDGTAEYEVSVDNSGNLTTTQL